VEETSALVLTYLHGNAASQGFEVEELCAIRRVCFLGRGNSKSDR